jgi:dephospho-CoA kinase
MSANGKATPLVLAAFGQHMSACDGSIDRPALGRKVFSDPEARALLEAILHPLVYQARNKFFANLHLARKSLAVLDVPLLFETGGDAQCDYLVTVWAPQRLLRQRAMQRAHMTDEKFTAIINAQLPQSEKIRLSDLALPTGTGHAESRRRLKKWIKKIKS